MAEEDKENQQIEEEHKESKPSISPNKNFYFVW